jgi:hypothetical protein
VPEPDTDRWLVTPASVLEAVDDIPEIARTPRFLGVAQIRDAHAIGNPKFRTRWSRGATGVEVRVEVALARALSDRRRADILSDIQRAIVRGNARLKDALQERAVSLQIDTCEDMEEGDLIAQAHSGGVWSAA